MPQFLERPPIAAVGYATLLHVKRARDQLSLVPRDHEAQVALKATRQQIEEPGLQVLPAPIELVDVGFIQRIHAGEEFVRDLLAAQDGYRDPYLVHLALIPLTHLTYLDVKPSA